MSDTKTYGPDVPARLGEPDTLVTLCDALTAARKGEAAASEALSRAVHAEVQSSVPWRKWERGETFVSYALTGAFFGIQWHASGWIAYAHADDSRWRDRSPGDREPRPTPRDALVDLEAALRGRRGVARMIYDLVVEVLEVSDG